MEFEFASQCAAKAAIPVFRTQLEAITKRGVKAGAKGSIVNVILPALSPQKKKVAEYTAKRLAALMQTLEKV